MKYRNIFNFIIKPFDLFDMNSSITPRLLSVVSPSLITLKSTELNMDYHNFKTNNKENYMNQSKHSISLQQTNFQSKPGSKFRELSIEQYKTSSRNIRVIPSSSKPSLTTVTSRNKLFEYKFSKKYKEEDQYEYQNLTNKKINDVNQNEKKEDVDEYEELLLYQQQHLPVPIEKKDDEKFKLLKMKQMKRVSMPSNKSVKRSDEWLTDYEKQIKTQLDYSTIKKRKISHSTRKVYSSMLKCYNSLNKEYVFPLFIDKDIGVYEYWQAHIIESNVDEDVMTDDEQLMLAGAYSLREIKEAVELYVKEGDDAIKNLKYAKKNNSNKYSFIS